MSFIKISSKEKKIEMDANVYITMSNDIYAEMMGYVKHYKEEVSGCGLVKQITHKDNLVEYKIYELFLPMQKNTGSSTDIEADEIHKLVARLAGEGKETEDLRFHWHSHADMNVFHSGTDEENYTDLLNQNFLVSIVANRSGDILGRIDMKVPFKITISGVNVYVMNEANEALQQRIDANLAVLDKHIEKNKSVVSTIGFNGIPSGYQYGKDVWDDKDKQAMDLHGYEYGLNKDNSRELGYENARKGFQMSKEEVGLLNKDDIEIVSNCAMSEPEDCYDCPKEFACETYWEYAGSQEYQEVAQSKRRGK